jgi:hypothetical protein
MATNSILLAVLARFYFHHRLSEDLDFFTTTDDLKEIANDLRLRLIARGLTVEVEKLEVYFARLKGYTHCHSPIATRWPSGCKRIMAAIVQISRKVFLTLARVARGALRIPWTEFG